MYVCEETADAGWKVSHLSEETKDFRTPCATFYGPDAKDQAECYAEELNHPDCAGAPVEEDGILARGAFEASRIETLIEAAARISVHWQENFTPTSETAAKLSEAAAKFLIRQFKKSS